MNFRRAGHVQQMKKIEVQRRGDNLTLLIGHEIILIRILKNKRGGEEVYLSDGIVIHVPEVERQPQSKEDGQKITMDLFFIHFSGPATDSNLFPFYL